MPAREPSPILVAVIAVALACVMDGFIKYVAQSYSALTIAFARFGFGALVAGGAFLVAKPGPIAKDALRIHLLRGAIIVVAATTFFYALGKLPLAEAVVLGFVAPLIVPFMALALLKEELRKVSLIAVALGFVGVVIAAYRPSDGAIDGDRLKGYIAMAISVPTYALSLVLLRYRAAQDGPIAIGVMGNAIPAIILAAPALAFAPLPALADVWKFALIGAFDACFWVALTWAYARAPAQTIAPIDYTALIWASLIGVFVFHEPPRVAVFVGAALIIVACLIVTWDEKRARLQAETAV